jgi:hypothetical protein
MERAFFFFEAAGAEGFGVQQLLDPEFGKFGIAKFGGRFAQFRFLLFQYGGITRLRGRLGISQLDGATVLLIRPEQGMERNVLEFVHE